MGFGGGNIFGSNLSLGQFGYMAEAMGEDDLVQTTDAAFNAAINDMKSELAWAKGTDINNTSAVNAILRRHRLDPSSLTSREVARINAAIE